MKYMIYVLASLEKLGISTQESQKMISNLFFYKKKEELNGILKKFFEFKEFSTTNALKMLLGFQQAYSSDVGDEETIRHKLRAVEQVEKGLKIDRLTGEELKSLAIEEVPIAQALYGILLAYGIGFEQDNELAQKMLGRAFEQGELLASLYMLGNIDQREKAFKQMTNMTYRDEDALNEIKKYFDFKSDVEKVTCKIGFYYDGE